MASAATVGDDGASGVAATVTATEATVLTGDSLLQLEAALQAELDGVGVALLADTSGVLLLCTVCHRLRAALFLFLFSHTHAHRIHALPYPPQPLCSRNYNSNSNCSI